MNELPKNASRKPQPPVGSPMARWIVIFFGLVLLALAVIFGRELWLRYNDVGWKSWARPFTDYIGNLTYHPWMAWAGALCCVIAIFLAVFVFKPRPKTHRPLAGKNESVWMRPVDIARMFSAEAQKVPGVESAETVAKPRSVKIAVNPSGGSATPGLSERVAQAVAPLAAQLGEKSTIDIAINGSGSGSGNAAGSAQPTS